MSARRESEELAKRVAADPTNITLMAQWGDACMKAGDDAMAAEAFSRVEECYARDGFNLKAIARLKQVLTIQPSRGGTRSRLVELFLREGMVLEATAFFREDVAVSGRAEPSVAERELFFAAVLIDAGREDDARAELAKADLLLRAEMPELAEAVARVLQLDVDAMKPAIAEIGERLSVVRVLDFSMPN